ncbi:hypothetical protein CY34DRAFT_570096 [Suillus luteus UH-Slu-Lm8-n1]|uniref:Uncharacterized protein n=1 Tax=Suillus luteus UH-Slu-Lm8-n1 TaxID=930992 RepID=A0A0D0AUG0_9AGAM|nr:hypothetical protein CY34DRAFT_570096 [Suillus luteus UH-Slu-Lm8-n1]
MVNCRSTLKFKPSDSAPLIAPSTGRVQTGPTAFSTKRQPDSNFSNIIEQDPRRHSRMEYLLCS